MFTIGHTESYDIGLIEYGPAFRKLGKSDDYIGGIVFLTIGDASDYLVVNKLETYSIYSLDCSKEDLYKVGEFYHLCKSVRIVKKESIDGTG